MLMEAQIDYEIVPEASDLSRFETLILTGGPCLGSGDAKRLNHYLAAGGKLLILGASALDCDGQSKLLFDVGGKFVGG